MSEITSKQGCIWGVRTLPYEFGGTQFIHSSELWTCLFYTPPPEGRAGLVHFGKNENETGQEATLALGNSSAGWQKGTTGLWHQRHQGQPCCAQTVGPTVFCEVGVRRVTPFLIAPL